MQIRQFLRIGAIASCSMLASACTDDDSARRPAPATSTPVSVHTTTPNSTATATVVATPTVTQTAVVARACDAEPIIMVTDGGVEFVRTPDSCFDAIPNWPYEARYVEIDGLRQAYVDEGPADGPVVLLLHGQPSWSYLYRKMIPVLADAGYRVIAMDHLGMGRSDKPIEVASYSFLGHYHRLERFVDELALDEINLFVQDWGSLIGLRYAGLNPDRFARIAVGDGMLPVIPAGFQPFPPVENPDEIVDIPPIGFAQIPAQQPLFYDGCDLLLPGGAGDFGDWIVYAMKAASFRPSEVVEGLTWFDLPEDEEAAYDAPFPSRIYMGGPRTFPSLVNDLPGLNDEAWAGLTSFAKPFLTIWAANDPGNLGQCATQAQLVSSVPGAFGQPHDRLAEASHFLQDDQGPEIARRLVDFYASEPIDLPRRLTRGSRYCEVVIARMVEGEIEAEVWGTQTLNDCPAESWEALDEETIQAETGALAVTLNGPRQWLPNSTTGAPPADQRRTFGDLEMRLLATLEVDLSQSGTPYGELTVLRTTTFVFDQGEEIYELTSPDGAVYVMQSLSQLVDPNLMLADLPALGSRLMLPDGWSYDARTLETDLVLVADGAATILTDDLGNTYQLMTADSPPDPMLPVLANGTGTVCSTNADCDGLEAGLCLSQGAGGICTVEGCVPADCGAPYVCCSDCSPAAASFLPFADSACLPEAATQLLTEQAGCTCEGGVVDPTATPTPTPTPGTSTCLPSVGRDVPGDLGDESPFGIADRLEIRAVNDEGCAALDGPLVAFNWFSFDDREQYLQYADGIAEIFPQRGHRVLFGGQQVEVLESPSGDPVDGGSYVHEELALALYSSAGGFLDMLLSPEFQAIVVNQQGGARQEDYVWGLQRCLIGCDDGDPPIGDGPFVAHMFDYLGGDFDAAIADLQSVPDAPEIVYAGDLVAEMRVIVGGQSINPQKPLWGRGVLLYRVADRDEALRWASAPSFDPFRTDTEEDVMVIVETDDSVTDPPRGVGFEILEIQSPNSIRAWISQDITWEEFDALELPEGWFKNQPREGDPDGGRFLRSPDATVDGEFLDEELFGFTWRHSATVTQPGIPLDEQGLLQGSLVSKFHELTFHAGSTLVLLLSPEDEVFFRIGRDANRSTDEPTIPESWQLLEYTTPEQLVIRLPDEVVVIRTDNQDSFQGPVPELAEILAGSGEITEISIAVDDFVFDARVAGPEDGEPVILLHGFPETSWEYRHQLTALGEAGYRAVAPNQRGYSPGARPPRVEDYTIDFLVGDVLGIADALGFDRFHLVGHDWGALVSWAVAAAAPDRLRTLSPISVPHPDAFARVLADRTSCQYEASAYVDFLVQPGSEDFFLANDAAILRGTYEGLAPEDVAVHLETLGQREALSGGLNWYRANFADGRATEQAPAGNTTVPTMFVWSDGDAAICRDGAEITGEYVDAPYRFEVLEGVNHWIPELAAEELSALLLDHLTSGSMTDPTLPVLANGTGTVCSTDADCDGLEAGLCLSQGAGGICTVEGCVPADCGAPYVCCSDCNPAAASFLPFAGSACLPEAATQLLTEQAGCTCEGSGTAEPPLELTPNLCDDPSNMARLLNALPSGGDPSFGDVNEDQIQRMIDAPTEGPFYMFNLIRYRERAEYFDGRETDLSGREANALYAPVEFLTAVGAKPVFIAEVDQQIDGDDIVWESVAVVEYPCPLALFAMIAHPDFQARAVHKDAGVERTIALVTDLAPSPLPPGFVPAEGPHPATEEDPAFELIHVQDFHEIAQYEEGVDEPERSGREAWEIYSAGGSAASVRLGVYPTARFIVQGAFLGDGRSWDEINIVHMPSRAAFQALLDDEVRREGRYHRLAALAHNYSLITFPTLLDIPDAPATAEPLPITQEGVGTLCSTDADCEGLAAGRCLSEGDGGFCTIEGCAAEDCGAPYVCCSDCNPVVAPFLPFAGSACLPESFTQPLVEQAGCTCEGASVPTVSPTPTATATSTATPRTDEERIGFEILEIRSPNSIRAWIAFDITRGEFDALELPTGWLKNQPREGDPDASRFCRSPDATADGEIIEAELFGFRWWHSATVTQVNVPLDEQGLLVGATVSKCHEVTFDAGSTITVLVSPDGEAYFRKGRDAARTSDEPSIPEDWRLVEYTTPEPLVIQLPDEVLVIRTDNQDSFQGPVPELAVALSSGCQTPASASFSRPFEVDSADYPFQSCAFATAAGRIHYFDEGPLDAEETILMVHGNPTWSFLYRNIAKAMIADGHRVVALDHLGMGMSDVPATSDFDYRPRSHADNLEELVVALDLKNVTLVAQDWGGPIGLGMATQHPERISRMLIMNTWAWSIDADAPGRFHALTSWSAQAKTFAGAVPAFFCEIALPGQSTLNATEADPTRGALFDRILSAYLSPAIDVATGSYRYAEPCAPMQIFAESISDDDAFQGEVEDRLGSLQGKPYSLLFGLRDSLFGALRCDTAESPHCPGASSCSCDPELLPTRPDARCSGSVSPFDVCKEPDGSIIEPYADRFVDLLGEESLVHREAVGDADHMIQEWAPGRVIQALRDLLAVN